MAAPTFVVSDSRAGDGTTAGVDTTGADLLVIIVSSVAGVSAVSDSNANTWLQLHVSAPSGSLAVQIWVSVGTPTVGAAHTFTVTGGFPSTFVYAFTIGGIYPDYTDNIGTGVVTLAPGAVNLDVSPQLAITGIVFNTGATASIDDSFTGLLQFATGGPNWGGAAAYRIGNSATFNPTWTLSASSNPSACLRIFMADPVGSGGGGGGSFPFVG